MTEKDWKWTVGVLIGIIIVILALWFVDEKGIEVSFSIIGNSVSIALALVAINISLRQNKDNQNTSSKIESLLNTIEVRISTVNDKLDIREMKSEIHKAMVNNIPDLESPNYSKDEVIKMISEYTDQLDTKIQKNLDNNLKTRKINSIKDESNIESINLGLLIYTRVIFTSNPDTWFSFKELHEELSEKIDEPVKKEHVERILGVLKNEGHILNELNDDWVEVYKKK